jgi:dihydrofolate reductase
MSVALIWAQAHDRVIGAAGVMPWHLPEDLKHFRELTGGGPVVMGRRTWESLPERFRPLPGRANVVVTRNAGFDAPGATVVHSLDDALRETAADAEADPAADTVWVIGGAQLYGQALPVADRVEVTELDLAVAGDTVAPELGPEWHGEPGPWLAAENGIRYRFVRYLR